MACCIQRAFQALEELLDLEAYQTQEDLLSLLELQIQVEHPSLVAFPILMEPLSQRALLNPMAPPKVVLSLPNLAFKETAADPSHQ